MYAHTVLTGKYTGNIFRFCIHPQQITGFPLLPSQETGGELPEKVPVHRDAQGRLRSKKKNLQFIFDPPTGNFKLLDSVGDILSGSFQYDELSPSLITFRLWQGDKIHGFGAAMGSFAHSNDYFQLLNQDTLFYSRPEASYSTFPFFWIRRGERTLAILVNTTLPAEVGIIESGNKNEESRIDIRSLKESFPFDILVFQGSPAEILDSYTSLTGRSFLPPVWALGFHQSRWSYKKEERVVEVASLFRKHRIPCDAIHLDIHYMDHYRIFTWHPRRFPDPAAMNRKLMEMGIRTVAVVDPAIQEKQGYRVYEEGLRGGFLCLNKEGEPFRGRLWAGRSLFPDFTIEDGREWWANSHAPLLKAGVSGIWNDMNEPVLRIQKSSDPLSEGMVHKAGSHTQYRNIYANLQALATRRALERFRSEERPFILSRAGFCGIQKYAALWTGDNHSTWEHLRQNLNMVINLGLSGVALSGADVGGFASGPGFRGMFQWHRNRELFIRWFELGSLMPFFRAHTVRFSLDREPWSYGEEVESIVRLHIRRRYSLLHYLYNLVWLSHLRGEPVVRPIFYEYGNGLSEERTDQFFLGRDLLVAPILEKGAGFREFWLPPGDWYDFESGELVQGDTSIKKSTPPGRYPLYVRAGAILPMASVGRNAEESLKSSLHLEIYPSDLMEGECHLDDGINRDSEKGLYFHQLYSATRDKSGNIQFNLNTVKRRYTPPFRTIQLRIPDPYRYMLYKGKRIKGELLKIEEDGRRLTFHQFEIPLSATRVEFLYNGNSEQKGSPPVR